MGRPITLPQLSGSTRWGRTKPAAGIQVSGRASRPKRARPLSVAAGGRAVLALVFGCVAILWHDIPASRLALIFGAYTLLSGVALISTFTEQAVPEALRWGHLLAGFASLLAGLLTLLWPHITAFTLTMLAGTWAVVTGVMELTASSTSLLEAPVIGRRRGVRNGVLLLAVAGIVSMAVGLVVLTRPDAGVAALAAALGIYALITGSALLAAALHAAARHVRTTNFVPPRSAGTNAPDKNHHGQEGA